ncbi:hypothetical protein PTKIN_Ptkin06aG0028600 [Pterospermum kingtungense]
MSSFTNTPNFDSLLLQTLMGRLQIRPPTNNSNNNNNPFLTQSLEDLLFAAVDLSDSDSDDNSDKTQLAKEESKLEKEIIRIILSGETDPLKPNSGQAVAINDHHICITFREENGSDYRVWEWHGHIMLFDEEDGYTPEYIYGNYFERLQGKPRVTRVKEEKEEEEEEEEEKVSSLGLRELIDGSADTGAGRILRRNINAGSPRGAGLEMAFGQVFVLGIHVIITMLAVIVLLEAGAICWQLRNDMNHLQCISVGYRTKSALTELDWKSTWAFWGFRSGRLSLNAHPSADIKHRTERR